MNDDLPPDWASEGYDPEAEENVSQYIRPLEGELAPIRAAQTPEQTLFSMIPGLRALSDDDVPPSMDDEDRLSVDFGRGEEQAAAPAPVPLPVPRPADLPSSAPRPPADLTGKPQGPGMLSRMFTGQDFQSNSRPVIENGQINWGDPDNPADFVRANAAMAKMLGEEPAGGSKPAARPKPMSYAAPEGKFRSPAMAAIDQQRAGSMVRPSFAFPGIAGDLSGSATYARAGEPLRDVSGIIFHHTAGGGKPADIVNVLNQRGLGVQYVMDRDGSVYMTLPDGSRGAHMRPSQVAALDNSNTIGVEMIARDNDDVTPAQVAASRQLFGMLRERFPKIQPYGHGEVNAHKQTTEGMAAVQSIRSAYDLKPQFQTTRRQAPGMQGRTLRGYQTGDYAEGGRVEDEFPTHYMPNVGRQVMNDGGVPDEEDAMRIARDVMTTDPMGLSTMMIDPTGSPTMAVGEPEKPAVRYPREDLEGRLSAGQQAKLSQIGLMLPNKAADIKEDDSGSYPVDAEGNRLNWIKRPFLSFVAKDEGENRYGLPYVLDVLTAGTGGGGMAAPVKGGGTYLGSGPILKKAEAASDAAANSAVEAAQAVNLAKRELSQATERPTASRIISQAGEYGDYVPKGGRERDPRKWHPISNTALSRPLAEMSAEHVLVGPRTERKFIKPEELEGKAIIPALADRTAGGSLLTKVNEMELETPVKMQAGESFMYGPAAEGKDKAAWASDPGIISALANKAKASAEKGLDPYLAYVAMGSRSGDYSHHMTDTLLEMLKNSKVSKDTIKDFDEQMRTNTANKWKAYKDWPGLTSPKIEDYLYGEGPAKARTKMAELMGQGQFQKAGMPDVGAARFAITAPELLHAEDYSAGRSIVKLDPQGRRIKNPEVPHKTYKDQLGADPDVGYVGGFEYDIPFNVMNKEFVDKLLAEDPAKYSNPSMMAYTYRMNQPTVEMTPEVVDRLSKYLEMKKQGLIP